MLTSRGQQFVAGEGLGQVQIRADYAAPRLVEQPVLAGQHDDRGVAVIRVVLDDRRRLVAIEPGHHDVNENHVRLVASDLGKGFKAVFGRDDTAPFVGQHGFGGSADGGAVVNDKHAQLLGGGGGLVFLSHWNAIHVHVSSLLVCGCAHPCVTCAELI